MNWKAHFILGFFLFLIPFYFFNIPLFPLFLLSLFAGLSSLLPDLDHDMAKARKLLNKLFPIIIFLILFTYSSNLEYSLFNSLIITALYFLFFTFLKPKHRGITHTILVAILYSLILYFILGELFAYAGFIGYFSHLLGDKKIKFL